MDKKTRLLATVTMLLTMPMMACSENTQLSSSIEPSVNPPSSTAPISASTPTSSTHTVSSTATSSSSSTTTPAKLNTHAEYMTAESDETIRIAGKAVYAFTNTNKNITCAYLQDGIGGYYLYDIPSDYKIEVGKSYEVSGLKGYYMGQRQVKDITSIEPTATEYTVVTTDVTAMTLSDEAMSEYHGGYVTLKGAVATPPNISETKAYSVTLSVGEGSIDVRVDPSNYSTADEFKAVNTLFESMAANQKLTVKGIMSSFGYSAAKLSTQIILTSADDATLEALSDADICNNVAEAMMLPYVVETDVNAITLPTVQEGVNITWESDNAAIATDGNVTHGTNDSIVQLTATVTKGEAIVSKTYTVVVLGTAQNNTELASTGFEDPNPPDSAYGQSTLKGSYKGAAITIDGHEWYLDNALLGNSGSDKKIDTWSCRQKPIVNGGSTYTLFDVVDLTYVDFYAATYGTKAPANIVVSYSTDSGVTWTVADTDLKTAQELQHYRVYLNLKSEHCRVKFEFDALSGQNQCLDNVKLVNVGA